MREYDNTIVGSKEDYNDMMANKEKNIFIIWVILTNQQQEQINIELDEKIADDLFQFIISLFIRVCLDFVSIMPVFLKQNQELSWHRNMLSCCARRKYSSFWSRSWRNKDTEQAPIPLNFGPAGQVILLKGSRNGAFFMD
jgi:hypothetical protein